MYDQLKLQEEAIADDNEGNHFFNLISLGNIIVIEIGYDYKLL